MTRFQTMDALPIASLETALQRARCQRPALTEQMLRSLSAHGQLTPLVTVEQAGKLQVVDGFKRLGAARRLGWETLAVHTKQLDQTTQWAVMLALNRSPGSLTELDEALILRELTQQGMKQTEISELIQRHKSWVSRRLGLLERLHPELIEGMKVGVLQAGVARRVFSLPPGNQLQLCAAAQSAGMGPRDTEVLVSLWHKAREPAVREYLLSQPRQALAHARPELAAVDARLTHKGQHLQRLLALLSGVAPRMTALLPPADTDLALLVKPIRQAQALLSQLATALGSSASDGNKIASDASGAKSSSAN